MVWATTSARDTRCSGAACPISTWSPAAGPRRLFTVDLARSLPLRLVVGGRPLLYADSGIENINTAVYYAAAHPPASTLPGSAKSGPIPSPGGRRSLGFLGRGESSFRCATHRVQPVAGRKRP